MEYFHTTEVMNMIEIYQRGNEAFMSQVTILIMVFGIIATLVAIVIPLFQYLHNRHLVKELRENIAQSEEKIKELISTSNASLESDFQVKIDEVTKKLNDFSDFVEDKKELIDLKAKTANADIDVNIKTLENATENAIANSQLFSNPKWIKAQSESRTNKLKAINLYQELFNDFPRNPLIFQALGILYYYLKEYDKSLELFKEILIDDDTNHYALLMVGKSYVALEQYEEAEQCLIRASYANISHCIELAKLYINQGKFDLAERTLSRADNFTVVSEGNDYKPSKVLSAVIQELKHNEGLAKEVLLESGANKKQVVNELKGIRQPSVLKDLLSIFE